MKTPLLAVAAVFAITPAFATDVSVRDLAQHPERFVGREIEIRAFCGNAGDDPGYMCSTAGAVYVHALKLAANAASKTIDESCGGLDWTEKSPSCRVRLKFTPSRFHADTTIDPGSRAIVIDTPEATAVLSPN